MCATARRFRLTLLYSTLLYSTLLYPVLYPAFPQPPPTPNHTAQAFVEDRVWPSDRNFEVILFDAHLERHGGGGRRRGAGARNRNDGSSGDAGMMGMGTGIGLGLGMGIGAQSSSPPVRLGDSSLGAHLGAIAGDIGAGLGFGAPRQRYSYHFQNEYGSSREGSGKRLGVGLEGGING